MLHQRNKTHERPVSLDVLSFIKTKVKANIVLKITIGPLLKLQNYNTRFQDQTVAMMIKRQLTIFTFLTHFPVEPITTFAVSINFVANSINGTSYVTIKPTVFTSAV